MADIPRCVYRSTRSGLRSQWPLDHQGTLRLPDFADHTPRRYFVDQVGRRVLIGLTVEETFEFETLDVAWDEKGGPTTTREKRWLELYSKHDQAWRQWISKNQPDRRESLELRI